MKGSLKMVFIALLAFIAFAAFFVVKIVKIQPNGKVSKNISAKNKGKDDSFYYENFNSYDISRDS